MPPVGFGVSESFCRNGVAPVLDAVIRGGTVVDGTGAAPFRSDVGIRDGRIACVGAQVTDEARTTLDARGLVVSPGFVDVHAHDDLAVLHDRTFVAKVAQGVTTTIVGNCGLGVFPLPTDESGRRTLAAYVEPVIGRWTESFEFARAADYVQALERGPLGLHVAFLAAHGAIRIAAMGFSDRPAAPAELRRMEALLEESMEVGGLGLSLGLMYAPGCFAAREELVTLARVASRHGGILTAHIRGEGDHLLSSLKEVLSIAEEAGAPLQISHLKAVGKRNWGTVRRAIDQLSAARLRGVDVACDAYPYAAGSTTILSLLPPWLQKGGVAGALEGLADPSVRSRVAQELRGEPDTWDNVALLTGFDRIVLAAAPEPEAAPFQGMNLGAIARELGFSDDVEGYLETVRLCRGRGTIIIHHMDEGDVREVIACPHCMVGSDGLPARDGHPHPRLYGTFPRILARYTREQGALTLAQAVHKMTGLSASRFGLADRGILASGRRADLVLFDAVTVEDRATYEEPRQAPAGIRYVLIDGRVVMDHGRHTGALAGGYAPRAV